MAYTIRQFVTAAYEEIGLASYAFDLSPEMLQSAARRLNAMLAEWNAKGIRLGATLASNPDAIDIDASSGVPDAANETIIASLAVRIAPGFGKTVSPDTKMVARNGYNTLLSRAAMPAEMQLGPLPAGAGHKNIDHPFLSPPTDPLLAGGDGVIDFS